MRQPPYIALLPDGRRLHLQDGPIDLVIGAIGPQSAVQNGYAAAAQRFSGLLTELVAELGLLRTAASEGRAAPKGIVARRMHRAVSPYADECFITPMAAVAGAVAEEILGAMCQVADLDRAYVNNGGDIALHLQSAQSFVVGLVDRPDRPSLFAHAAIAAESPIRGIATSGWRGRSFSLGIADAVTILAATAAQADAAATIVANAVDLPGHRSVERVPACSIKPDSDLGDSLVTRAVGVLTPHEIDTAIGRGLSRASDLLNRGLLNAAAIHLQGETRLLLPDDCAARLVPPALPLQPAEREFAHA